MISVPAQLRGEAWETLRLKDVRWSEFLWCGNIWRNAQTCFGPWISAFPKLSVTALLWWPKVGVVGTVLVMHGTSHSPENPPKIKVALRHSLPVQTEILRTCHVPEKIVQNLCTGQSQQVPENLGKRCARASKNVQRLYEICAGVHLHNSRRLAHFSLKLDLFHWHQAVRASKHLKSSSKLKNGFWGIPLNRSKFGQTYFRGRGMSVLHTSGARGPPKFVAKSAPRICAEILASNQFQESAVRLWGR